MSRYKMKKLYFLPQWVIENKKYKRKRLLKIFIIIVFLINIFLIDLYLFSLNKVKKIDNEIAEKNTIRKNKYYLKNTNNKDKTLECFLILTEDTMIENLDFKNLYIENNNIDINISCKASEHENFINKIEKENKFTIKHVSSYNEIQDGEKYKMNLQLK